MGLRDEYERELARLTADYHDDEPTSAGRYEWLDIMATLRHEGHDTDWLIEEVWPEGRHVHLHAARKAGKSLLVLWCACCIAIGKDPLTGEPRKPRKVGYWDMEMTEDDFRERVEAMAFTEAELALLVENLHYYLHQPLPPLDTELGGRYLLEQTLAGGEEVVMIDTMSRVVQGDENSSDTYINFYRFTGQPLKSHGINLGRLDHEGHQEGRSRGSSAKADDVDIVWQLKPTDDGLELIRKAARVSWVAEKVVVRKIEEPSLSYVRVQGGWPEGTKEKAKELESAGVPLDAGRSVAIKLLKACGLTPGKTVILNAALKYRRQQVVWP